MSRVSPAAPPATRPRAARRHGRRLVAALFPLLALAAVLGAVALARTNPRLLFGILFVAAAAIPLVWVTVSALWPARADRKCPACAASTLERLDPRATYGLRCRACGWSDEAASAWLLAEEEGPLEGLVLEQRRRRTPRAAVAGEPAFSSPEEPAASTPVDSPPRTG